MEEARLQTHLIITLLGLSKGMVESRRFLVLISFLTYLLDCVVVGSNLLASNVYISSTNCFPLPPRIITYLIQEVSLRNSAQLTTVEQKMLIIFNRSTVKNTSPHRHPNLKVMTQSNIAQLSAKVLRAFIRQRLVVGDQNEVPRKCRACSAPIVCQTFFNPMRECQRSWLAKHKYYFP